MATNGPLELPEHAEISKVEVRLPRFSLSDPELFFARAEFSFTAAGVTSDAVKFVHVANAMDDVTADAVRDILLRPPVQNRYAYLKTELIRRYAVSQERKTKQLLETEEMGDRKPSQFLRHLQNLAGESASEEIIRMLWEARLPHATRVAIASQRGNSLDDAAKLADAIDEMTPRPPIIAPIGSRNFWKKRSRNSAND